MPIYEYKCKKCASQFEVKKGFNDPADATCPNCHSAAYRIFLPAPIIFKGSGFYVTDHKTTNSTLEDSKIKSTVPEKAASSAAKPENVKAAAEKTSSPASVSDTK